MVWPFSGEQEKMVILSLVLIWRAYLVWPAVTPEGSVGNSFRYEAREVDKLTQLSSEAASGQEVLQLLTVEEVIS